MILSWSLTLLIVSQGASSADDPCPFGDNRCKAKLYLDRAETASTPRDRATYLFGAYRLYLHLFDKTGSDSDLCASRRAFDRSIAIKGQPEKQRETFAAQLTDLTKREGDRGSRCGSSREAKPKPLRIANRAAPQPLPSEPAQPPPASNGVHSTSAVMLADAPVLSNGDDLLPVVARVPRSSRSHRAPELPRQDRTHQRARPGRGLALAGGATLGVGLALTAAAGYLGGRLLAARRDALDINSSLDGFATDEQAARSRALLRDYERLGPPTLALALAGGTSVVVGAVLIGVGARRLARVGSRAALLPFPGGLAVRARF